MNTCAQATSGPLAAGIGSRSRQHQHYHDAAGHVKDIHDRFEWTADGVALGTLLLGLQKPGLSQFARRHGYGLAEIWARQFVTARHAVVA